MGLFDKLKKPQDPKRHPDAEPLNETLEKALFAEIEVFDGFSDEKVIFERGTIEDQDPDS